MNFDYSKRGYLLPEGCKDLIDVWKLQSKQEQQKQASGLPPPLPPIIGEIFFPKKTTVLQLANVLGQKPFLIIADLMELGVFANVHHELDFEVISKVVRKHGYVAGKSTET